MGKLYNNYLELKRINADKSYIFKNGIFYIILGEDADKLGPLLGLKLTNFNDKINKCGFPVNSFDKYKNRIDQLDVDYEIIENADTSNELINNELLKKIKHIKKINLDNITPLEALKILKRLQESFKNE